MHRWPQEKVGEVALSVGLLTVPKMYVNTSGIYE